MNDNVIKIRHPSSLKSIVHAERNTMVQLDRGIARFCKEVPTLLERHSFDPPRLLSRISMHIIAPTHHKAWSVCC